jgi:hypothetical protein
MTTATDCLALRRSTKVSCIVGKTKSGSIFPVHRIYYASNGYNLMWICELLFTILLKGGFLTLTILFLVIRERRRNSITWRTEKETRGSRIS